MEKCVTSRGDYRKEDEVLSITASHDVLHEPQGGCGLQSTHSTKKEKTRVTSLYCRFHKNLLILS